MVFVLVNFAGLLLISAIIWWFWLYKSKAQDYTDKKIIEIMVDDGVYTPSVIKVKQHQVVQLKFIRKDPNPCAAYVIFDALNISELLEVNKAKVIQLNNLKKGEFEFTCEMGMYRGKLIVD